MDEAKWECGVASFLPCCPEQFCFLSWHHRVAASDSHPWPLCSFPPPPPPSSIYWHRVVVDEAQQCNGLLGGPAGTRELWAANRWLLTGTPDNENNREQAGVGMGGKQWEGGAGRRRWRAAHGSCR